MTVSPIIALLTIERAGKSHIVILDTVTAFCFVLTVIKNKKYIYSIGYSFKVLVCSHCKNKIRCHKIMLSTNSGGYQPKLGITKIVEILKLTVIAL